MKKPSSDLYELAKTLTPSERRHFTLQMGKRDLQYGRLFDALLELPAYDEAALIRALRKKGPVRHLSVAKRHLYTLLLDDLLVARKADIEASVRKGTDHIRMLWEKGLNSQALKLISRHKKTAREYELFRPLLELLELEKKMLGSRLEEKQLDALYQQEAETLEQLANANAYWRLSAQISRLQRQYQKMQGSDQQAALLHLFEDPLLQHIGRALSVQSKIYFLRAKATYFFTTGQPEEAYQMNSQLLELLDHSPAYLKQFPEVYLQAFNNYLIDSLQLKKYEAFGAGLDKWSALSGHPSFRKIKNLDAQLFRQRYLLEVNGYLSRGAIDKAGALVPVIEKGLQQHGSKLQKNHRITFAYLMAYVLWLNGRLQQSLDWIHPLFQEKEDVVLEIFQFTRLLNLLVHFELGNWEHLSYLLPSTRRYLRQRRELYRSETALFQFLQKTIHAPEQEQKELRRAFALEVGQLYETPGEKRFFNYLDLKAWLQQRGTT